MRNAHWLALVSSLLAIPGCARSTDGDAGGADAPVPSDVVVLDVPTAADAGVDAPLDAPPDAPTDAPIDVRFFVDVPIRVDAFVGVDAPLADAPLADGGGLDAGFDGGRDAPAGLDATASGCSVDPAATVTATLRVTSDDNTVVWANGVLVDATPHAWSSPQTYSVALFLHPDHANVIAIEGINTHAPIDGRDRGTLVELSVGLSGGAVQVLSDASWRMSSALESGWSDPTFDDGAWAGAVEEGTHGIGPWGAVFGTSDARWIWSYDSDLPAGAKGAEEHVYFRRTLYFAVDGTISDVPAGCP